MDPDVSRSMYKIPCQSDEMAATLDSGTATTGLLIVSGGNEIRSGAHGGMAELAQNLSANGYPVLRFDRRGIGDSTGDNGGFLESREDIAAASRFFRQSCAQLSKILAFGNCDAATALAVFQSEIGFDGLCIANPWTIEQSDEQEQDVAPAPSAAAIRARYWERLKRPGTYADLLNGRIDFGKLAKGLRKAAVKQDNTTLALDFRDGLQKLEIPCDLLIAERDTTARTFMAGWKSSDFADIREKPNIALRTVDTASHGFADDASKQWLKERLFEALSKL